MGRPRRPTLADKTADAVDRRHRDHRRHPRAARLLRRLSALAGPLRRAPRRRRTGRSTPEGLQGQDARRRRAHRARGLSRRDLPGGRPQALPDRRRGARGGQERARPTPISATACSSASGCRARRRAIAASSPAGPISSRASSARATPSPCHAARPTSSSAINAALEAIYEKGVYAELYLRYFPVGFF